MGSGLRLIRQLSGLSLLQLLLLTAHLPSGNCGQFNVWQRSDLNFRFLEGANESDSVVVIPDDQDSSNSLRKDDQDILLYKVDPDNSEGKEAELKSGRMPEGKSEVFEISVKNFPPPSDALPRSGSESSAVSTDVSSSSSSNNADVKGTSESQKTDENVILSVVPPGSPHKSNEEELKIVLKYTDKSHNENSKNNNSSTALSPDSPVKANETENIIIKLFFQKPSEVMDNLKNMEGNEVKYPEELTENQNGNQIYPAQIQGASPAANGDNNPNPEPNDAKVPVSANVILTVEETEGPAPLPEPVPVPVVEPVKLEEQKVVTIPIVLPEVSDSSPSVSKTVEVVNSNTVASPAIENNKNDNRTETSDSKKPEPVQPEDIVAEIAKVALVAVSAVDPVSISSPVAPSNMLPEKTEVSPSSAESNVTSPDAVVHSIPERPLNTENADSKIEVPSNNGQPEVVPHELPTVITVGTVVAEPPAPVPVPAPVKESEPLPVVPPTQETIPSQNPIMAMIMAMSVHAPALAANESKHLPNQTSSVPVPHQPIIILSNITNLSLSDILAGHAHGHIHEKAPASGAESDQLFGLPGLFGGGMSPPAPPPAAGGAAGGGAAAPPPAGGASGGPFAGMFGGLMNMFNTLKPGLLGPPAPAPSPAPAPAPAPAPGARPSSSSSSSSTSTNTMNNNSGGSGSLGATANASSSGNKTEYSRTCIPDGTFCQTVLHARPCCNNGTCNPTYFAQTVFQVIAQGNIGTC